MILSLNSLISNVKYCLKFMSKTKLFIFIFCCSQFLVAQVATIDADSSQKTNNAFIFHFIPSIKDNIYGVSFGPIGSESICNVSHLRKSHGLNFQLIGQGLFIPLNVQEFSFDSLLLTPDTLLLTTQNTRSLHNGLLFSTFGTYTDFSNGLVLSACCSFGRKINGLAVNLVANKYVVVNGVELGLQNQAHTMNGLQLGLFNRCVELNGLQIGLWNVNEKRKLPFMNW
jgi:hypothetical protein